jgi:hypothetical protein
MVELGAPPASAPSQARPPLWLQQLGDDVSDLDHLRRVGNERHGEAVVLKGRGRLGR